MAPAQAREIDAILVTELSRWGRSTIHLMQALQSLQGWNVSVLAVSGLQFDLSTPHGKMIASVMAALAEFERDLIRERIKSGIAAAEARGRCLGRQPGQCPSDRKATKVLKVGRGWAELPVDRPPCRAQQEHGRSNPARARAASQCNRPEDSEGLSDTHSGRVSAARGARDQHSTLARHALWSQSDPLRTTMCRQCRSRVPVAGLSSSFRTRLPWRANAGAFCAPTATFTSVPVRVKTTLSFRASFRRYALCLSPI